MLKIKNVFLVCLFMFLVSLSTYSEPQIHIKELKSQQNVKIQEWIYPSGKLSVKGYLYLPTHKRPLPLVIFNHDGISGVSKEHELSCIRLAKRGYAVFAPSYRGEDGSEGVIEIAKGEVNDVLNALNILSKEPYVDKDRIYLMGASHGALISLLASARTQPGQIKGLIFAYGVADIYQWWDHLKETKQLGKDPITRRTYGDGPQARPESFSIRHGLSAVANINAPVLILNGQLDTITPPQQAQTLKKALDRQNKESYLYIYPNCLHGFLVYAPYLSKNVTIEEKRETEEAWQKIFDFLEIHKN
ncbi:dienelactone hydrolase family protein [bacterium]|nr:dienelactone hydrolase family protein [bacterium]